MAEHTLGWIEATEEWLRPYLAQDDHVCPFDIRDDLVHLRTLAVREKEQRDGLRAACQALMKLYWDGIETMEDEGFLTRTEWDQAYAAKLAAEAAIAEAEGEDR